MRAARRVLLVLGIGLGAVLALAAAGAIAGCCVFSAPRYRGVLTDHFDGERFHGGGEMSEHGFDDFLRWRRERQPGEWHEVEGAMPGPPPPARVDGGRLRVTFVNHSTLLVQMDGLNILTDPMWSERASPLSFVGPARVRPPGLRFEDLPPIDVVLISHNHYDHMDAPTLRRLAAEHQPRFVVPLGNAPLLERMDIGDAVELDWWDHLDVAPGVRVWSAPAQHFSSRGLCDRNGTLWSAFVVEGPAGRVYFAGDTGHGPHFRAARQRLGPMRLALLPIGAYIPRWFMAPMHTSPADALQAALDLEAAESVAMHFGTFRLADDGQEQPLVDLAAALAVAGSAAPVFHVLGFGEGRDIAATPLGAAGSTER